MESFNNQNRRKIVTADCVVDVPPKQVFPLLCPVREYDWIEVWQADIVYTDSGVAELDCVFKTAFPNEGDDVWIVSRYEPSERIEFVRVSAKRAMRYIVFLTAQGGGTRITWTQVITDLGDAKEVEPQENLQKTHDAMVERCGRMLAYYFETGKRLPLQLPEDKG